MTQQEFEKRTGFKTSEAFDYANRVYMAAGQMDKDAFCEEFKDKAIRESNIISALTLEVEGDREAIRNLERQVNFDAANLQKYIDMTADFLILQAEKWSATDLREKAIASAMAEFGLPRDYFYIMDGFELEERRLYESAYRLNKKHRLGIDMPKPVFKF